MDTANQLRIFAVCVTFGVGLGALYDVLSPLWLFGERKGKAYIATAFVFDACFFALAGAIAVLLGLWLRFPSVRAYFYFGYAFGFWIYSKTLRRIVAFLKNICYNSSRKLAKAVRKRKNSLKKQEKSI